MRFDYICKHAIYDTAYHRIVNLFHVVTSITVMTEILQISKLAVPLLVLTITKVALAMVVRFPGTDYLRTLGRQPR